MASGPSRLAEALIAVLLPPACREEVLGDLHERYVSPGRYAVDVMKTVPLVIASRVRRTTDLHVLLIQTFVLFAAFSSAALLGQSDLLRARWGLWRLALPVVSVLGGLVLDDAYASPGRRSATSPARGPALGVGLVVAQQAMFGLTKAEWALPRSIVFYGCALGLLLTTAVRFCFPPVPPSLQRANEAANWLKQTGEHAVGQANLARIAKVIAAVTATGIVLALLGVEALPVRYRVVAPWLAALIAYQVWRRG